MHDGPLTGDPRAVRARLETAIDGLPRHPGRDIPAGREGAVYHRALSDGREITVYPLVMSTGRVCVGEQASHTYDDAYCYETVELAVLAASVWDGDGDPPEGWFRHVGSGRRRPAGDPGREYIQA